MTVTARFMQSDLWQSAGSTERVSLLHPLLPIVFPHLERLCNFRLQPVGGYKRL